MKTSQYPEHKKLKAVQEQSQAISEFLEWLGNREIVLGMWNDNDLWPHPESTESILARYFGIDQRKLEKEKRGLLKAQRKANQ